MDDPPSRSVRAIVAVLAFWCLAAPEAHGDLRFRHRFIDDRLPGDALAQTALADIDGDGDLDFVIGRRGGAITWYERRPAGEWATHPLGERSPSDVGGTTLDVDHDGDADFIAGGVWYENTGMPRSRPFTRHIFDAALAGIHDLITADIDGDGKADVITMSDRNDLRWYRIPRDPTGPWHATRIGDAVHSGISAGDIDGDGDIDIVRSNVWLENTARGTSWIEHRMTAPWGRTGPGRKSWERNATQTRTADVDRDGRLDVVITDGEIRGARIAWLQAPADPRSGTWTVHVLPPSDSDERGAYHSLAVADFDLDGDLDIFTCEMESVAGARPPRWFVWENIGPVGSDEGGTPRFVERVILDAGLGGHEAVIGDVDGDGDIDICAKPWRASRSNANGGRAHADFLENLAR